jgi:uncharacterized alpha/beta hydrolase family protein
MENTSPNLLHSVGLSELIPLHPCNGYIKTIHLDTVYPVDTKCLVLEGQFSDKFSIELDGDMMTVTRIDRSESWGVTHYVVTNAIYISPDFECTYICKTADNYN